MRQLLIAAAKYCFINEKSLIAGKELFKKIPVNHAANEWSSEHFDAEGYKAEWMPQKTPTLLTTGSNDNITPLSLFKDNKMYHRDNILIKEIDAAGHYPWFENPNEIIRAFQTFCKVFDL